MPFRIPSRSSAAVFALLACLAAAPAQAAKFEINTDQHFAPTTFEVAVDGKLWTILDLTGLKWWGSEVPAGSKVQVTARLSSWDLSGGPRRAERGINPSCTRTFWMNSSPASMRASDGIDGPANCVWTGGQNYPVINVPNAKGGPAIPQPRTGN